MSNYKEKFDQFSSEYLVERKALGSELSDDAHKAIDELLTERAAQASPAKALQEKNSPIDQTSKNLFDGLLRYTIAWCVTVGLWGLFTSYGELRARDVTPLNSLAISILLGFGFALWCAGVYTLIQNQLNPKRRPILTWTLGFGTFAVLKLITILIFK